jgi:hypothetical protein
MKTVEEIVLHLEKELVDAHEKFNQAQGNNAYEALCQLVKESVLTQLLEEINK